MAIYYGTNKIIPKQKDVNIGKVYYGNNLVYNGSVPYEEPLRFQKDPTSTETSTIKYTLKSGFDETTIHIQYSLDGAEWNDWAKDSVLNLDALGTVYVRNTTNTLSYYSSSYYYLTFEITGKIKAAGNINSMINYSNLTPCCYYRMFNGCTGLTSAPELPATELAYECYYCMFRGCTGLTSAPQLPAETLTPYCYYCMFYDCTGLTSAPELPAETLAESCYRYMFFGCTDLTSAPELPAETLTPYCYSNMFDGCTGLTSAPELPAETLTPYCYSSMFNGCTGLTSAPELPATELAYECYYCMFFCCTGLTSAPELPAETLAESCYCGMFDGCTGLKISNTGSESGSTLFFTCPSSIPSQATLNMFYGTGGSFTGDPVANGQYYWYR